MRKGAVAGKIHKRITKQGDCRPRLDTGLSMEDLIDEPHPRSHNVDRLSD